MRAVLDSSEIYDVIQDEDGIWRNIKDPYEREKAVKEKGYKGFRTVSEGREVYGVFEKVPAVKMELYSIGVAGDQSKTIEQVSKELHNLLINDYTDIEHYNPRGEGVYKSESEKSPSIKILTGDIDHVRKALIKFGLDNKQESILLSKRIEMPYYEPSASVKAKYGIPADQGPSLLIDYTGSPSRRFNLARGTDVAKEIGQIAEAYGIDGYGLDPEAGTMLFHHIPEFSSESAEAWLDKIKEFSGEVHDKFPLSNMDVEWYTHDVIYPAAEETRARDSQSFKKVFPDAEIEILERSQGVEIKRMESRTLRGSGPVITQADDVAHMLQDMRNDEQETLWTFIADEEGNVLDVYSTTGLRSSVDVHPSYLASKIFNTPGAKLVVSVHNHPGGSDTPSSGDRSYHKLLAEFLNPRGILLSNLILGKDSYGKFDNDGNFDHGFGYVDIPGTYQQPIAKGVLVPVGKQALPVLDPTEAKLWLDNNVKPERSGVILLNTTLEPLGYLQFPEGLTDPGLRHALVLQAMGSTGANRILFVAKDASFNYDAEMLRDYFTGKIKFHEGEMSEGQRGVLPSLHYDSGNEIGPDQLGSNTMKTIVAGHWLMPNTTKGKFGNPFILTKAGEHYEGPPGTPHARIVKEFLLKKSEIKDSGFVRKDGTYVGRGAEALVQVWMDMDKRTDIEEPTLNYGALLESEKAELARDRARLASGELDVGSFEYFSVLDKWGHMLAGNQVKHTSRFAVSPKLVYGLPNENDTYDPKTKTYTDDQGRTITNSPILSNNREERIAEMVKLIFENKEFMNWYDEWSNFLSDFESQGMDNDTIAKHLQIMAILSPSQSVKGNLQLYKKTIDSLESGEPLRNISPDQKQKIERIWDGTLTAAGLSVPQTQALFGPKVGAFARALLDYQSEAVTIDRWMGRLFGYDFGWSKNFGEERFYVARSIHKEIYKDTTEAAAKAGVSPAQAQAALWNAANPEPESYLEIANADPESYLPSSLNTLLQLKTKRINNSNLAPWTERGAPGNIFVVDNDGVYYEGNGDQAHVKLMQQFNIDFRNVKDSGMVMDDGHYYHRHKDAKMNAVYQQAWLKERSMLDRGVEDPVTEYQPLKEEASARIKNADIASRDVSLLGRITDGFRTLAHKITREYEHLPRTKEFAQLRFDLLKLSKQKQFVSGKATEAVRNLVKGLSKRELKVFERKVMYDDLLQTALAGEALPFGYESAEEIQNELSNIESYMTPNIRRAILERGIMWNQIKSDYIAAMKSIGLDVEKKLKRVDYFRHQVLEHIESKGLYGTGKRLTKPVNRGFQKQRRGSRLDINPNFVGPETEVISQMLYDIQVAKVLKTVDTHYNHIDEFRKQAKEAQKDDPDITWQDLIKGTDYVVWQPLPGHSFFLTNAVPDALAESLMRGFLEANIDPAMVKQVLAMGGPRKQWVVKSEVAQTLDNIQLPPSTNVFAQAHRRLLKGWKIWQLISPRRWFKYGARNLTGDADAVFAGNPASFLKVPQAAKEIVSAMVLHNEPTQNFSDWSERGGIASTLQAQEIDDLKELARASHLYGSSLNPWKMYWKIARLSQDVREATLRYASYLSYLQQMEKNDGIPKNFGASMKSEILGLSDIKDRAFWLSNDLLGAYDRVGLFGQSLRAHLFPFWSWKEANARRYFRLFANAIQDKNLCAASGRKLLGAVATTPFRAYRVGKFALKATAFWGLLQLWNHMKFPDEEEELPEHVKNRPHIILGRDKNGDINYFSRVGALPDLLEWMGLDGAIDYVNKWSTGKMTLKDIAMEMAKAPVNIVAQGAEPFGKLTYELFTNQSLFPDVFEPSTIRDKLYHVCKQFGLENEYGLISNKPSRPYKESVKNTFMYSSDPLEAAYYDFSKLKRDFLTSINKGGKGFWITPRGNALYYARQALRFKDQEAARKYMEEYLRLGGSVKGLKSAIENLGPLAGLSQVDRIRFLATLTVEDKKKLVMAYKFYLELANPAK